MYESNKINKDKEYAKYKQQRKSDRWDKKKYKIYLKKFLKTKKEQAEKIKQGLEEMDLLKLKREHIVKIIDLMPEDASDLNKIFIDVSLNEEEINKILELVKNSKS